MQIFGLYHLQIFLHYFLIVVRNDFYHEIEKIYQSDGGVDELKRTLGRGRAKLGMFEGDMSSGELEIGQAASQLKHILPAREIVHQIITEFNEAKNALTLL